jgi:hypothetical protein
MRLNPLRSYHRTTTAPRTSQKTSPSEAAVTARVSPASAWASK